MAAPQLAVLPLPTEHEPWWPGLLDTSVRPLRIVVPSAVLPVGRLSRWQRRLRRRRDRARAVRRRREPRRGRDPGRGRSRAAARPAGGGRSRAALARDPALQPRPAPPCTCSSWTASCRRTIPRLARAVGRRARARLAQRVARELCPSPGRRRLTRRPCCAQRPRKHDVVTQAAAGHPGDHALCRRQGRQRRQPADCQAVLEREPARAEPEGGRGLPRARGRAAPLSGRPLHRAAAGDRPPPQSRSRRDRLRRRLGRADRPAGPRLCRARRRGALQPARLPDVPAGRAGGGRPSGRSAGARAHRRCRRVARARHLAHPAGVPGQPEQPDRQLPARGGAAAGCAPACPPT